MPFIIATMNTSVSRQNPAQCNLPSRRRRIPRCNEPSRRTHLVAAAAVLLCLGYCGSSIEAFSFGVRPLVVRPMMLASTPSTFRRRLPVSTKTNLQMVLSMSSASSVPSASCNATDGTYLLASAAENESLNEDDRFQLDQLLFEKQALEQRARLEQILISSAPNLTELKDDTGSLLSESELSNAVASKDDFHIKSIFGIALSDIWKARVLLLLAAALYGTNFSLVKILGDTMPVAISGVLRFGMASMVTLPWLFSTPPAPEATTAVHGHQAIAAVDGVVDQHQPKRNWWDDLVLMITGHNQPAQQAALAAALAGFEVGMWNSVGYVAQAVGLATTAASKSAFLCSLAVVTVPLLDFFVGKRLLPKQIVGALLAVAGVGFLELGGASGNILTSLNYGDLASLVQPLAFGMGFWRMENAMSQYPQHAARSTAAQMLAVFCAYGAYLAVACGITHTITLDFAQILTWVTTPTVLFSLFWTGVITTALTVYMETLALKTLSAAETTLIFSTEPLWGTAFAALIMGEQLGMDAAMGAVLILSGCLFSNLGLDGLKALTQQKPPPKKEVIDPEEPTPVLVRSGIAGAIGSWVSGLGEAKCVAEVAAAAVAEDQLEHLDDVIQTLNEIL